MSQRCLLVKLDLAHLQSPNELDSHYQHGWTAKHMAIDPDGAFVVVLLEKPDEKKEDKKDGKKDDQKQDDRK